MGNARAEGGREGMGEGRNEGGREKGKKERRMRGELRKSEWVNEEGKNIRKGLKCLRKGME